MARILELLLEFALTPGNRSTREEGTGRKITLYAGYALTPILAFSLWGHYQVYKISPSSEEPLRISVIQGNIPQEKKWDPVYRDEIMDVYRAMTLKAAQDDPDLIVWPESSTPGYLLTSGRISDFVYGLARDTGIPILLGSSVHAKVDRGTPMGNKLKNGAFLVDPSGRILSEYYKVRLLPFGEYLPYRKKFPWPRWMVPKNGLFLSGEGASVFTLQDACFGAVICWESLFSDLVRSFVKNGAQFVVNLNNEAWFGKTAASRQFLSMAVFRAVENGVPLLRAANTGISAYIDPAGRILDRVVNSEGNDIFVRGIMTVTLEKGRGSTFFARYGNVFGFYVTILSLLLVLIALLPDRLNMLKKGVS